METEVGSGRCKHSSKDANTTRKKDDSLFPLISLVDSDHDSGRETDIEIIFNDSAKKSKSSSSASSSSSDPLAEDFFLMDAEMLKKSSTPRAASPKAHGDAQTLLTEDKNDVSSDMFSESEEPDYECPLAPSLVSDVTHESSLQIVSPVQSPPIQVMERPGDFDPDRIPASVFSSKPSTAVDWSVASNESLFSIQIGNNSFSREQFLMMNGDMCKYEESYKSGELYRSGELYMLDVGKKSEEAGVPDETMKDPPKENVVDQVGKNPHLEKTENSSAVNRHSDGSSTSCQSFAFPILTNNARTVSGFGSFKQQGLQTTDSKNSPKARKASKNCWCCCSLPSWSCSSCRHCWCWTSWC